MELNILFQTIQLVPWTLFFQVFVIGILVLIVKKYYDNISSYFMFRSNKDLGRNVKIIVNGRPGIITYYTWRFIYIKLLDTENELIIPITKWTSFSWEICKNGDSNKGV